jgi:hypothetical protein
MFTNDLKFDDNDKFFHSNVGRWLCIEWKDGLFPPPKDKPYGTHIAGYLVCDHQNGIKSFNLAWMVLDAGRLFRVGNLLEGIEAIWFFKYDTLKRFNVRLMTDAEISFLGLPDRPPGAEFYSIPDLDPIRQAKELDKFRHPGYLDDVAVLLTSLRHEHIIIHGIQTIGAAVWVRLENKISSNKYKGILLNNTFYGLQAGHEIIVQHIEIQNETYLISHIEKESS